jgi:hypothetical protein
MAVLAILSISQTLKLPHTILEFTGIYIRNHWCQIKPVKTGKKELETIHAQLLGQGDQSGVIAKEFTYYSSM